MALLGHAQKDGTVGPPASEIAAPVAADAPVPPAESPAPAEVPGQRRETPVRVEAVSLGKIHPVLVRGSLVASPDSRRVAYVAAHDGQQVVVDGVEGRAYDAIGASSLGPTFGPDGPRDGRRARRLLAWVFQWPAT
jgi:hypothetical protein